MNVRGVTENEGASAAKNFGDAVVHAIREKTSLP